MDIAIKRAKESDWQDLRFIRLKALQSDPSVFKSDYQKESTATEADWKIHLQSDAAIGSGSASTCCYRFYDSIRQLGWILSPYAKGFSQKGRCPGNAFGRLMPTT
jgi:hypothetical protein